MATTRQQKFYSEVYAGARQAGLSDAQARLAASQASLETGYGKSMPGGNMFGIKAGKSWKGPTQNVKTWEDVGGRVNIVDKFRSYVNPFDSLGDWAGVLERRFPEASAATSFTEAVGGLRAGQPGGYATDRNYNSKLNSIDQKFGQAAQQDYGLLGREVPVPSAAPRGLMDALGSSPAEVAAYADRGLRSASFPATPAPVERVSLPSFDSERFGPAPSTTGFDAGRFGGTSPNISYDKMVAQARAARPEPVQVTQFDSGRFGTATTQPQGVAGLRDGLLSQQAQMAAPQGILGAAQAATMPQGPSSLASQYSQYGMGQAALQQAMAAKNLELDVADQRAALGLEPMAQTLGYVDPTVTTQQPAQPAQAARPARVAQAYADPIGGGFGPAMTPAEASAMMRDLDRRKMMGGVLGGVAGGMLLGPIGALAGGYFGRNMGAKSYFPNAPTPAPNSERKGSGRDSLSSYGEKVSRESKQFDKAVSSGKGGLW